MRLTWKDAVTTVAMAVIVAVYVAFLAKAGWPLLGSVRGTAAVILGVGAVGGCALAGVGAQYQTRQTSFGRWLIGLATVLGIVALGAGVYALIAANTVALAVLFGATVALWLVATVRHAFAMPPPPIRGRDVHEVIDPYQTTLK